jgi:pyruvate dehydrogenase E1 component alpha subunit
VPRTSLPIPHKLESLAVLAADGTVDHDLEPNLPNNDLLKLYKTMRASRALDKRALQMQRQGRIGTYAPCLGQEAASLGFAYALTPEDWFVPSFRENAAMLWRGWPMVSTFLFWGGYEAGATPPKGVNDLPIAVPVASQCHHGMGIAWGLKLRGTHNVCITFVGDGGTSEGDFHEAMNFAGVYDAPFIMVVQNNQWAISLPREKQTASPTIAQKAIAYGMDALQVDGNDILAVIVAAQEAVARARTGGGPSLIEAVTYRLAQHTSADDPRKYRSEDEVKPWEDRDPLKRFAIYLRAKGVLDDKVEKLFDEEIDRELDEAAKAYAAYKQDPYEFFDHVLSERTSDLDAQRAELKAVRGDAGAAQKSSDYSRVL